jgi:thioredoxin-related protein
MKKIFIFLVLLSFISCQQAKDVAQKKPYNQLNWLKDFKEAAALAKKEGKNLLAQVSTEWCPYCKYIEEHVVDNNVAKKMSEYVLVYVDGDKNSSQPIMERYKVRGFPTFILFDSNSKEIRRFNDASSPDEFLAYLKDGNKEAELASKLDDAEGKDARKIALELLEKYPKSISLPYYYKKLGDSYSSSVVKNSIFKKASSIIEANLSNLNKLDQKTLRITLDQHIDILADIYKEAHRLSEAEKLYLRGAKLLENEINKTGGIKNNLSFISGVTYYYINAGRFDLAIKFLNKAIKEAPRYWPVYTNYTKALLAKGSPKEALSFARQAYALVEEVARPRVALIWAETYAALGQFVDAIDLLKREIASLNESGSYKYIKDSWTMKQINKRIEEYQTSTSPIHLP